MCRRKQFCPACVSEGDEITDELERKRARVDRKRMCVCVCGVCVCVCVLVTAVLQHERPFL